MVATVLRLRYRILANDLSRRPWQLVGFCFGILWAVSALGLLAVGAVVLALTQPVETGRVLTVVGGSALLLGWVIGPLVVAGLDATVDPARLAPFPFTRRDTMLALAAVGLSGVPGLATILAAVLASLVYLATPLAVAVAVPMGVLAAVTCVVAARLVGSLSSGLGSNRKGREIVGTLVLAVVIMTGPILTGIVALLDRTADLWPRVQSVAAILSWTPLGAAWAVPADVAAGMPLSALARFAVAAATLVVLWLVWARTLDGAVTTPVRPAARAARPGSLGLFGRFPSTPVGATWARSLTAWLRDPRYLRQLIVVPLLPVLLGLTGGLTDSPFIVSSVIVALVLAIATYSDVSYDGTAFASVLASGIRGRDDRWGRLLGAASVGVPIVVVLAVLTTQLAGAPERLPAILGASLGLLLAGYAVSAVSSALLVTPVAAPGDSPFKTVPGQTFVSGLLVFVVMAAIFVLALPSIVLAVLSAATGNGAFGWAALAVSVVVGIGGSVAGVALGGRIFDRGAPELLQRIKAFPTR